MNKTCITEKIILFSSVFMILFTIVVTIIASVEEPLSPNRFSDFGEGWVTDDGKEVDFDNIGSEGTISRKVPELEHDTSLYFQVKNLDVKIYIDGECIYKNDRPDSPFLERLYCKTSGSDLVEVPVYSEYSGKTMSIYLNNPYSSTGSRIVNMYIGNSSDVIKYDIGFELGGFCFSMIIIFFGFIFTAIYIPLKKNKIIGDALLYLGLFSITLGMCMITDCKLLQIIVSKESLFYTVSQFFMALIIAPMLLFFGRLYENINLKIIYFLSALSILNFASNFILNFAGIKDLHETSMITVIIFLVSMIYLVSETFRDLIKKNKKNFYHNIGVIFFVAAVILDSVFSGIGVYIGTSFFTKLGIAVFTFLECTQIICNYIQKYKTGLKEKLLSRLAYHDGLTDLLNRTSFMEELTKLEAENDAEILIAMFDVNNLKYVNDTFGHTCGDELIITSAKAIENAFSSLGKCFRTGGDEFVFISKRENAELDFLNACKTMDSYIEKVNETSRYPVAIAMGYSIGNSRRSIKDLLDDADEKMYANKKIMKEKQGFVPVR